MTTERTPAWFLNPTDGKFGSTFACDDLNGVGPVTAALDKDGNLSITHGESTTLVPAKANQYGPFYVAAVGDKRYFMSRRISKKDGSFYLLAKEAIDRERFQPQRPASYGAK
mgnify:CR=1 FL=1